MDLSVCADCGPTFWEVMAPLLLGVLAFVSALSISKVKRGRVAVWLLFGVAVAALWIAVGRLYRPW
jgi:hypothetical protein